MGGKGAPWLMTRIRMNHLLDFTSAVVHLSPIRRQPFLPWRPRLVLGHGTERTECDARVGQRLADPWMAQDPDLSSSLRGVHGLEVIAITRVATKFCESDR